MTFENVVLVTIDSLRADHVYGDAADTPSMDDLSADSTTYYNAFAQGPYTTFSMPSLFTSRYPSGLGYVEFSDATAGVHVDGAPTIAEMLQEVGYETAGFHSNPLLSNLFGFGDGFETFDARLPFAETDRLSGRAKILADKLRRLVRVHPYLSAEKLNQRALDWLASRDRGRPFFLWLHYMDVHGPYQPRTGNRYLQKFRAERRWRRAVHSPDDVTEGETERLRRDYAAEVEYTDRAVGTLLDGLEREDVSDETVVAVTADHGEQFGEHGTFSHPHQLYDELLHVPLVVDVPGEPSSSVEMPVELLGLAPTICKIVGVDVPESMEGAPLPTKEEDGDDTARVIAEADLIPSYHGCVRTDRWKYVRDESDNAARLYDLDADPAEQGPVDDRPAVEDRLGGILDEHVSDRQGAGADDDIQQIPIDDAEVERRLEDLGYLE